MAIESLELIKINEFPVQQEVVAGESWFVITGPDGVGRRISESNMKAYMEGKTDFSMDDFYEGYINAQRKPYIFEKGEKDMIITESGSFTLFPETQVGHFIFVGEVDELRGFGYALPGREIKHTNHTGRNIIIRNKYAGPSNTGYDFGGSDYTFVNGSTITFKSNGGFWQLAPNNQIAFSDHLDSVNTQVSIDPNGLKTLSRILDFSGKYTEFKQQTQWFNETPITNSNLHFPVVQKIGSEFFMNSDVVKSNTISVEAFRVDATDSDHTVLQRAFDFISAAKYSYSQFSLRIPGGRRYRIDQPLVLNTISDVDIIGDGIRKSSITATSEMESMIVLSKPSGSVPFVGRCKITKITISGGGLANCLIDGRMAPYSTYKDIEFIGLAENGIALKIDGWVNTVRDNKFNNQSGTSGLTAILVDDTSQVNGLLIQNNSVSTHKIAVHINSTVNLATIKDNKFDYCSGTGIYIAKGSKGINITENYFERCGTDGITITKGAEGAPTELWKGAIIGHQDYISTTTWIYGLNIWGNIFAACSDGSSGTMTFSGLVDAKIEDNFPYGSNLTKYWVDLRWEGCFRTLVRRVKISQAFTIDNQVEQLIGLNADSQSNGHCGIVAIENKRLSYINEYSLPVFNDFMSWGVQWDSFHEGDAYRGHRTIVIRPGSRPNKELVIPVDNAIAGRYYRVNWFQRSATSATTSLDYKIDGVTNITFSAISNSGTWQQGGRGALIYIPSTATNISFTLGFSNPSTEREIAGFSIVPASYEISSRSAEPPSDTFFKTGGTPEGFQFAKMGSISQDVFNGKSYVKNTDISLNTGWKEIADTSSFVPNQGASLSGTNGTQITGSATNGAITKTTIGSGGIANGFPANIGDAHTYVGASLARSYSFFKGRDTNKIWIQSYDSLGVGQGWVEIGASILSATATLDFPAIAAGESQQLTVTVTGAALLDDVRVAAPAQIYNTNGATVDGWVSAANTVTVRVRNNGASSIDPGSGDFKLKVFK